MDRARPVAHDRVEFVLLTWTLALASHVLAELAAGHRAFLVLDASAEEGEAVRVNGFALATRLHANLFAPL